MNGFARSFKKMVLIAVAAVMVATACVVGLAACKSDHDYGLDPDHPTEITVWHYYNGVLGESFKKSLTEFNATVGKEKGIIVTEKAQGSISSIEEKFMESIGGVIGADPLPDIFSVYSDTAYSVRERLSDLNQYLTQEEIGEYIDSYMEEGKIFSENEGRYIFPIAKSVEVLALNQTDWDRFAQETGADIGKFSTWEGIVELAREYYNWSGGKAFFGRDAFANYMLVGSAQLGHPIFQVENNRVVYDLDRATLRKLWDNYYVPYVNGWFYANGKYRTDDIKTGDIVAGVGSISGIAFFPNRVTPNPESQQQEYAIEGNILPVPNFAGCSKYAVQQGAGMAVVKSESKREYAATLFLKWFTAKENNLEFSLNSAYLPVKKSANDVNAVQEMITQSGTSVKPLVADALITGVGIVNSSVLYTPKPFAQGTSARSVLENLMPQWAKSDREKIVKGEVTLQQCLSDDRFNAWVNALRDALTQLTE